MALGTVPYVTNVTPSPLSSENLRGVGTWKSFAGPASGGACFWPKTGVATESAASVAGGARAASV